MKFISTKTHGVLDYLVGMLLIGAPWLLGFNNNSAATWVPVTLGVMTILYSLLTNYELGLFRVLSMRTHLIIDLLSGAFLAASPWVFSFSEVVYLPHVIFGLLELVVTFMTNANTSYEK